MTLSDQQKDEIVTRLLSDYEHYGPEKLAAAMCGTKYDAPKKIRHRPIKYHIDNMLRTKTALNILVVLCSPVIVYMRLKERMKETFKRKS